MDDEKALEELSQLTAQIEQHKIENKQLENISAEQDQRIEVLKGQIEVCKGETEALLGQTAEIHKGEIKALKVQIKLLKKIRDELLKVGSGGNKQKNNVALKTLLKEKGEQIVALEALLKEKEEYIVALKNQIKKMVEQMETLKKEKDSAKMKRKIAENGKKMLEKALNISALFVIAGMILVKVVNSICW